MPQLALFCELVQTCQVGSVRVQTTRSSDDSCGWRSVSDALDRYRVANDTPFGLGAAVFTTDLDKAARIAEYELMFRTLYGANSPALLCARLYGERLRARSQATLLQLL